MSSSVSINKSFIHHAPPYFMLHHASWECACCFLLAWPKISIFKPVICIFPSCASSVRLLFFQSHITHHCFCTLHLYITVVKSQLSLVRTQRAPTKWGRIHAGSSMSGNGMWYKSHSVLSLRVCLWLQVLFFYLLTIHAERVCVILCIRSQRCTSWWRL